MSVKSSKPSKKDREDRVLKDLFDGYETEAIADANAGRVNAERERDRAQKEVEVMRAEVAEYREKVRIADAAREDAELRIDERDRAIRALESERVRLAGEVDAVSNTVEASGAVQAALAEELSAAKKEADELGQTVKSLREELAKRDEQLLVSGRRVEDVKSERDALRAALDGAEEKAKENSILRDVLVDHEVLRLRGEMADKDGVIRALEASVADAKRRADASVSAAVNAGVAAKEAESRTGGLEAELKAAADGQAEAELKLASVEAELVAARAELHSLRSKDRARLEALDSLLERVR